MLHQRFGVGRDLATVSAGKGRLNIGPAGRNGIKIDEAAHCNQIGNTAHALMKDAVSKLDSGS